MTDNQGQIQEFGKKKIKKIGGGGGGCRGGGGVSTVRY